MSAEPIFAGCSVGKHPGRDTLAYGCGQQVGGLSRDRPEDDQKDPVDNQRGCGGNQIRPDRKEEANCEGERDRGQRPEGLDRASTGKSLIERSPTGRIRRTERATP